MSRKKDYIVVTTAYWTFMLTDGALRMLVLLYFHDLGYSPINLAFIFLIYEFFGVLTNMVGGWIANIFGLKSTLTSGLFFQVIAIVMLSFLDKQWNLSFSVPFIMITQSLSGIAKDLTKMSSKTAVKFLTPKDDKTSLFRWVSILTGSKNAIKGLGFFVGAALLQFCGFQESLWIMAVLLTIVLTLSNYNLPKHIGDMKPKQIRFLETFKNSREINILSTVRVFLFGARDIWFVVGTPLFLTTTFGWTFTYVGTFMACWVIVYGFFQAFAPKLIRLRTKGESPKGKEAFELSCILTLVIAMILTGFIFDWRADITIVGGLFIFGSVFALNSALHSFLILDYAKHDKAAVNVGFYYMANAIGRFVGTLLSGVLYQYGGLKFCLIGSTLFVVIATITTFNLKKHEHPSQ